MIPMEKVQELAEAHARIEDPATDAIWIRRDKSEVWLVEVIPSMADDDKAEEETHFNPGVSFRFPLALVAGNRASLERALERDRDLSSEVASGQILVDHGDARALVDLARRLAGENGAH